MSATSAPHHRITWSGSVIASHTRSSGWLSRRSKRITVLPSGRVSIVPSALIMGPSFRRGFVEVALERVQPFGPVAPVGLDPGDQVGESVGAQLVEPSLSVLARADEPRLAQDAQVPRRAGLREPGALHELVDGARPLEQQIEDLPPVRLSERLERHRPKHNIAVI